MNNEEEKCGNKKNDDDDSADRTIDLNRTDVQGTSIDAMADETGATREIEIEETSAAREIEIEETPQTGKKLREIIIPVNKEQMKPALKWQNGLKGNSVVVCPLVFLHNNETLLDSIRKEFNEMYGPYAYGKIIQVPNRKKNVNEYMIEYDNKKSLVDDVAYEDLCTLIPGSSSMKALLKRGVERANVIDYRFTSKKRRKRKTGATGTVGGKTTASQDSDQNNWLSPGGKIVKFYRPLAQ